MRPRVLALFALVSVVCFCSLREVAYARRKEPVKVPARIHYSGNFEGELEPCG